MQESRSAPFVSVIVLSFNSSKLGRTFLECLESVLKTEYAQFEVLLVDNGSTDTAARDAFSLLSPGNQNLRYLRLEENLGFTGGNNAAFQKISQKAKYVGFLNDDVVVAADWLAPLVDAGENNHKIAAIGPTGSYLAFGLTTVTLSKPEQICGPHKVGYVNGHCIVVKCSAFRNIMGFNPSFFIYNDEVDLCERLRSLGGVSCALPPNRVIHAQLPATAKKLCSKLFWDSRNMFFLMYENYPPQFVPVCIALMIANRARRCVSFLLSKNAAAVFAMARGCIDGLLQMKKGLTKYGRRPFRDKELLPVTVDFLHIFLPGQLATPLVDAIILHFQSDHHL